MAVLHVDVIYVGHTVESYDKHSILTLVTSDVLDIDVTHCRSESTAAYFLGFVVEVDLKHRFSTLSHLDIAGIYILDDTSTTSVGLDTHNTIEVRTVHLTVLGK